MGEEWGRLAPGDLGVSPDARPAVADAAARVVSTERATVTIDHGYQPATVAVKAGRPVQLTLVRKEIGGCGDVVNFPTLGIKRTLKAGQKTVITFTPKKVGTVAFTCGMNMYQGQVVAR